MENNNIPNYVLANGISKDGFEKLLSDIKNAVMINKLDDYSEMLEFVKTKDEDDQSWSSDFEKQFLESKGIINDNLLKIEKLFNRIFKDWEIYKEENNVLDNGSNPVIEISFNEKDSNEGDIYE